MTTQKNTISFIIFTVAILFMSSSPVSGQALCTDDDYSPCTCQDYFGIKITCNGVTMAQVGQVFLRTRTIEIEEVYLNISSSDSLIPADILNNKRALSRISLRCPADNYVLNVDLNAFRNTKAYTDELDINNCALTQTNSLNFLTGFNVMNRLVILSSNGIQTSFPGLPTLSGLTEIRISYSAGFNALNVYPTLSRGLRKLELSANTDLTDSNVGRTLSWAALSSANTLRTLDVAENKLTRIPSEMTLFSALDWVDIYNNAIPSIASGALVFSNTASPELVSIFYSGITNIAGEAFQGNFLNTTVYLQGNGLTRFESSVFRNMVRQMNAGRGSVHVGGNPFDCTNDNCHLAWLIRDEPNLIWTVNTGQCSDFTDFYNLDPAAFANCP